MPPQQLTGKVPKVTAGGAAVVAGPAEGQERQVGGRWAAAANPTTVRCAAEGVSAGFFPVLYGGMMTMGTRATDGKAYTQPRESNRRLAHSPSRSIFALLMVAQTCETARTKKCKRLRSCATCGERQTVLAAAGGLPTTRQVWKRG